MGGRNSWLGLSKNAAQYLLASRSQAYEDFISLAYWQKYQIPIDQDDDDTDNVLPAKKYNSASSIPPESLLRITRRTWGCSSKWILAPQRHLWGGDRGMEWESFQ